MIAALALAGSDPRPPRLDRHGRTRLRLRHRRNDASAARLAHSQRDGKSVFPGLATDYAAMIKAALALHAATLDPAYLAEAQSLAATLRRHHWDAERPGYFLSADDAEALIIRPRADRTRRRPSANALMAANLVRLWHLTGDDGYRRDADDLIAASAADRRRQSLRRHRPAQRARPPAQRDRRRPRPAARRATPAPSSPPSAPRITPNIILSVHDDAVALPPGHPAAGKTAIGGRVTAYVCRGEVCSLPVTEPAELAALLAG